MAAEIVAAEEFLLRRTLKHLEEAHTILLEHVTDPSGREEYETPLRQGRPALTTLLLQEIVEHVPVHAWTRMAPGDDLPGDTEEGEDVLEEYRYLCTIGNYAIRIARQTVRYGSQQQLTKRLHTLTILRKKSNTVLLTVRRTKRSARLKPIVVGYPPGHWWRLEIGEQIVALYETVHRNALLEKEPA